MLYCIRHDGLYRKSVNQLKVPGKKKQEKTAGKNEKQISK